jgi:Family of unknown function (DUF5317)
LSERSGAGENLWAAGCQSGSIRPVAEVRGPGCAARARQPVEETGLEPVCAEDESPGGQVGRASIWSHSDAAAKWAGFQLPLVVMVLAGFALFAGVVSGLVSRGRFSNLADIPMRYSALVLAWLAGVTLADPVGRWIGGSGGDNLGFGLYLVGLAALVAFAVINAVHMPGMWLIALGALANLVVCANNHGTPYSITALHNAGVTAVNYTDVATKTATKHPERAGDQLKILGDVVPIRVLKTVVSPGDLLFAFGLASVTANGLTGRRGGRRVRGIHRARHLPKVGVLGGSRTPVSIPRSGGANPSDPATALPVSLVESSESPSAVAVLEGETAGSTEGSANSVWSARLDLLRATGDPEVLIDVTGGVAGPEDVTPAHALALALKAQNIPDDQIARLVSAAVSSSSAPGSSALELSSSLVSASSASTLFSGRGDSSSRADDADFLSGDPSFQAINRIDLLELLSEV